MFDIFYLTNESLVRILELYFKTFLSFNFLFIIFIKNIKIKNLNGL